MNKNLGYLAKEELLQALEENYTKFWFNLDVETHFGIQITQVITGIPHPLLNNILRAQFTNSLADEQIEQMIFQFKKRDLPFSWWVDHRSSPKDLGTRLKKHLSYLGTFPYMAIYLQDLDISAPSPQGLDIVNVNDTEMLSSWGEILQTAFQLSEESTKNYAAIFLKRGLKEPFRHYIGLWNGKPIASATLFFLDGVAGIYNLAVLPEMRGKGIATAMVISLLLTAQSLDCRIGILQSSMMMVNTYQRLGFQKLSEWKIYFWAERVEENDDFSKVFIKDI